MKKHLAACLAAVAVVAAAPVHAAKEDMDPALYDKARRSTDYGMRYLREQQQEDGSWSGSVGITALALRAFLESHRGYNESDGPFIERPIAFLLANVRDDGSISDSIQNRNYNTAVAITALKATGNPAYDEVIANGQKFLADLQLGESDGYPPEHRYYGGIGYGGDERPDLSNQYHALEAMTVTDYDRDDPLWQKALVFVSRSQNNSETNDQEWAANDGGFTYMPGFSPHGETGSYGGMMAAGLLSLLFAGADKNDPRVQAAYGWMRENWTLDENPGAKENQGLFYYYNALAKCMRAYGEQEIVAGDGTSHNWRNELSEKLLSMQNDDGSWINPYSSRWWEGNPHLVTAWSIIALNQAVR